MPTKNTFKNLASRFFTDNNKFADFVTSFDFTFSEGRVYDPVTGTYSGDSDIVPIPCIRSNFKTGQFDNEQVEIQDILLKSRVDSWVELGRVPNTDSLKVTVDGILYQVVNTMQDAADAIYSLHLRRV